MVISRLHPPEEPLPPEAAVLDVRWRLGRTDGYEEYRGGHLPGAVFVDLERDLADPPAPDGTGGRHPLPDLDRFAAAMRRCGVDADAPVVVYDDNAGVAAARCWWLLTHAGHRDVRLLDGGYAAWLAAGGVPEADPVEVAAGDFVAGPGVLPVVDADGAAVLARRGVLLDARAATRFAGESEPVDPIAGHIPGARSMPTSMNLSGEDIGARFADPDLLVDRYRETVEAVESGRDVGVSCGSGITAAHSLFALGLVGITGTLYAGSWSDWVSDPTRPVETGFQPSGDSDLP